MPRPETRFRITRLRAAVSVAIILTPWAALAQVTSLSEATYWLEAKSQQLVRQSRTTMNNGTSAFIPQAGGGYQAFWLRDYAYMLEGCPEAFTPQEMKDSLLTFVGGLSASGAGVDNVGFNGVPSYLPGGNSTQPVADGSQFTVDVAYQTYQQTHDTALLQQVIGKLVQTMNAVPLDPNGNGLVYLSTPWNRCPWGFTDTVQQTGDTLMCSLLYIQSCDQLASLLGVLGQSNSAAAWQAAAAKATTSVQSVFWNSSTGLFNAATGQCNQPDIMGSAFAVQIGVAAPAQATAVANYFNTNYNSLVVAGQVRNLPGGTYWQSTPTAQGTYQNGGYWGVASGWFASTLSLVNPSKADQMLVDAVNSYKAGGVNEWVNAAGTPSGVANYCASATMPLILLKQLSGATSGALPQPVLVQLGGTLNPANDIALQSSGGTAFAANCISGYTQHSIAHLNDGNYGNSYSWIGGTNSTFCGIAFPQATTISSLAFGRDNLANDNGGGPYDDRYTGMYVLQYTCAANPSASTPDSAWTSFGSLALDTDATTWGGGSGTYLRHLYQFSPIAGVTGVRIELDTTATAIAIDELEVYGPSPQWTGGGSATWSNSSNWTTGTPATGSLLTFSGSTGLSSVNDLSGFSATALSFSSSAGAFTLSGNSLTLAGNVVNSSAAVQTVSLNMALANPTCIFNAAAGNLTINGALSGTGGLTAVGSAVLTLAGSNTYSGATNVTAGTLAIGGVGCLGGGNYSGNVINNGALVVNTTANQIFGGVLSGAGAVTVNAANLTLSGANTYTGPTTVSGGTLSTVLPSTAWTQTSSGVTVAGGASYKLDFSNQTNLAPTILKQIYGSSPYAAAGGQYALLPNGATLMAGQSVALPGTNYHLDMQGDGNLVLYNGVGPTNPLWASGTNGNNYVIMQSDGNLVVYHNGGGAVWASGTSGGAGTVLTLGANGGLAVVAALSYNNIGANAVSGTMELYSANTGAPFSGGVVVTSGGITGSGTLNKTGAGSADFSIFTSAGSSVSNSGTNGLNAFSGTLNIQAGTLTSDQQTGATPVGSGQMQVNITNGAVLNIAGGGLQIDTLSGAGNVTTTGVNNPRLTVGANNGSATFAGVLSGTLALTKAGNGTQMLTGVNTYTGATTIDGGTLALGIGGRLGSGNYPGAIAIAGGAVLDYANTSAAQTLTGVISGGGSLQKDDGNDLILNQSSNNTVNTLTVNAGRVFLTSSQAAGTIGTISVAGGATLEFAVSGGISPSNAMIFASGSNLVNRQGTLTLNSAKAALPTAGTMIFNYDDQPTYGIVLNGGYALSGPVTCQVGGGNPITGTVTLAGMVCGTGTLAKTGPGALVLTGTNSYTGGTSVNGGVLSIIAASNLGTGALTLSAGTLQTSGIVTIDVAVSVTDAAASIVVSGSNDTTTLAGLVTGNGGLTKTGLGNLALSNAAGNDYAGDTNVLAGTLLAQADNALSPNSNLVIGDGASVVLDFGGGANNNSIGTYSGNIPALAAPALAPAGIATVPEPGTLVLLVAGALATLIAWRRRSC